VHPVDQLLEWFPEMDFAVLQHHFARHGRDYVVLIEDCLSSNPGQHELVFTHCVHADCETRVRDDVWPKSWSDEFLDYQRWVDAKEPAGYLWGTNWSDGYPGIRAVHESDQAAAWTKRLCKEMFETTLETDRFLLRLIFHSLHTRKISDKTDTISQVLHRL
jgi:hypothetical protein